jgi:hypothetical protein
MPNMPGQFYKYILSLAFSLLSIHSYPFNWNDSIEKAGKRRINIIVSSKSSLIDPAVFSFQFQAATQQLFHKKKLYFIIPGSVDEMKEKIKKILVRENAMIGCLWFDSHGHMGRRLSLVQIGKDEINYQSIRDPYIEYAFREIAVYCDSNTQIGLGACYSASSAVLPPFEKFPEQRMNGDSLMMRFSEIMNMATVFGTESWVMTNPGIFNSSFALAGNPNRKRFRDPIFLSCWKKLGEWTSYSVKTKYFKRVQTLTLDADGNILPNYMTYLAYEKHQEKQMKIISKLKKGNFNTKYFYIYEFPPNTGTIQFAKIPDPQNSSN